MRVRRVSQLKSCGGDAAPAHVFYTKHDFWRARAGVRQYHDGGMTGAESGSG
jgi:hypothetical protein